MNVMTKYFFSAILFFLLVPTLHFQNEQKPTLVYGKYSCTASKYNNGSYEFIPRGSIILVKDGSYSYLGFKTPSKGKFTIDTAGNLLFFGGYLDKGKATKTDRPNKYLLVFPTNPDNRWTCTLVTK